jgi:hypothetical protein
MLAQVWCFLRDAPAGLSKDGHNVRLYKDALPTVEVGVQVNGPFEPHGSVVPSILPRGLVATATHTGPIGRLGETHDLVCAWCARHRYELTRVRPEIYGDPDPNTGDVAIDIFWALATPWPLERSEHVHVRHGDERRAARPPPSVPGRVSIGYQ